MALTENISGHLKKVLHSTSIRPVSRNEYVKHLRSSMVATDNLGLLNDAVEPVLSRTALDGFEHIVISEHALLGPVSEMLTKRTMFPKAKRRVQNIDRAFPDRSLNLHLAIAPQAECWAALLADDDFSPARSDNSAPVHSWANLVSRITAACPRAQVTVWNFEQPDKVVLPFLSALLGIDGDRLDRKTRTATTQHACQQLKNAKLLSKIIQLDEDLQTRMDVQYELDLTTLAGMPKVTLIE
ncbi:hypothetical protein ACGYLM_18850 [Sulfitobacter sp. 1A10445]|uniref:hypothetical protein n=1 Tax=unclassified Sulfitobacter TaxID=196795 RepID=UPI003744B32B